MDAVNLSQIFEAQNRIGKSTDAAGVNTLYALLKRLDASMSRKTPFQNYDLSMSLTSTSYVTVASISGKSGTLTGVGVSMGNGSSTGGSIRVTVDGVNIYETVVPSNTIASMNCGRGTSGRDGGMGYVYAIPNATSAPPVVNILSSGNSIVMRSLPSTSASNAWAFHPTPYPFYNSVLIEARLVSGTSDTMRILYEGAYD